MWAWGANKDKPDPIRFVNCGLKVKVVICETQAFYSLTTDRLHRVLAYSYIP